MQYDIVRQIFNGVALNSVLPVTDEAIYLRKFFYQVFANSLQPIVNVIYDREAYESKIIDSENGIRLSMDKNLRSVAYPGVDELFVDRDVKYALDDYFILEVKFNNYCPVWIKPILAELQVVKGPASKYVLTIDSHTSINKEKKWDSLMKSRYFNYRN
jgi:hypothetical protein